MAATISYTILKGIASEELGIVTLNLIATVKITATKSVNVSVDYKEFKGLDAEAYSFYSENYNELKTDWLAEVSDKVKALKNKYK